jgi:hypothetical protein
MSRRDLGKIAALMGGRAEARSRRPACGDATAQACVAAAVVGLLTGCMRDA